MGAFSHFAIQKSIYQILGEDSPLMSLVTGVYENIPQTSPYPYIAIGETQSRDWSTKTSSGLQITTTLHIYSREGGRKQSAEIMDRLHALLHQGNLSLTGHSLIMLRFEQADIRLEKDGLTYHGIMQFRALTEAA